MADIHILAGSFGSNGSGSYRVAFHCFTAGLNIPTDLSRTSAVLGLGVDDPDELTAIQNGTVTEVVKSIPFNKALNIDDTKAKIRALWDDVNSETVARMTDEYRFYGTTLERSS